MSATATQNRLTAHLADMRERVAGLEPVTREGLEDSLAITFDEHFAYQNAQARAHALGRLSADEARVVYAALGPMYGASNGGWEVSCDLATKVTVTRLMAEILR